MFFWQAGLFFLLFEAFTLFAVIGEIGFFKTFFLWLLTVFAGSMIIQRQGIATLMKVQGVINRGAVPVDDLFDGICLVIAGLLLMMPGFLGDIIATILLIPKLRSLIRARNFARTGERTDIFRTEEDGVIDGTYVRVEENVEAIVQKTESERKDAL